jgi:hypothetical protein
MFVLPFHAKGWRKIPCVISITGIWRIGARPDMQTQSDMPSRTMLSA